MIPRREVPVFVGGWHKTVSGMVYWIRYFSPDMQWQALMAKATGFTEAEHEAAYEVEKRTLEYLAGM